MRVTNTMLGNRLLEDLDRIRERMYRLETDISSGVWLHRPSDSPADVTAVIRHQEALDRLTRYQTNISDAKAWMTASEEAISGLLEIVNRARELTVQGSSGTSSPQSLDSIRREIDQLRKHAIDLGNAQHNGYYLFSGLATDRPPFQEDPVTGIVTYRPQQGSATNVAGERGFISGSYAGSGAAEVIVEVVTVDNAPSGNVTQVRVSWNGGSTWNGPISITEGGNPVNIGNGVYFSLTATSGDTNAPGDRWTFRLTRELVREVAPGQRMVVNITGDQLGGVITDNGKPRDDDLFATLQEISADLAANDQAGLNAGLARLDTIQDRLLGLQAELGARQRTLELTESRVLDLQVMFEGGIEKIRGTDMERALLDYTRARSAYEVALGMGARILPQSLLDYLR